MSVRDDTPYFTRETKGIDLAAVDQADRDDLAKAGAA
jgi:hypothetical protein